LTSIYILTACESIGCDDFGAMRNDIYDHQYRKSLQSITLESGSGLTLVGPKGFGGCPAFECLDIPVSVIMLGSGCFAALIHDCDQSPDEVVYIVNDSFVTVTFEGGS
jgi:hypothetical protein